MDPYEPPQRSLAGAAVIRGLVAAILAFAVYWLLVGGQEPSLPTAEAPTTPAVTVPTATTPPPPPPPAPAPAPEPTPTAPATATPEPTAGQIGAGVTVQVLFGAGTDEARYQAAIAVLEDLGYEVTAAGQAIQSYTETTVFASPGHEGDAAALVAADPRFTVVGDNPGNLTEEIDIHVVVGDDWPLEE